MYFFIIQYINNHYSFENEKIANTHIFLRYNNHNNTNCDVNSNTHGKTPRYLRLILLLRMFLISDLEHVM